MYLIIERQKRNPNMITITHVINESTHFYERLYKGEDEAKALSIINDFYDSKSKGVEHARELAIKKLNKR